MQDWVDRRDQVLTYRCQNKTRAHGPLLSRDAVPRRTKPSLNLRVPSMNWPQARQRKVCRVVQTGDSRRQPDPAQQKMKMMDKGARNSGFPRKGRMRRSGLTNSLALAVRSRLGQRNRSNSQSLVTEAPAIPPSPRTLSPPPLYSPLLPLC